MRIVWSSSLRLPWVSVFVLLAGCASEPVAPDVSPAKGGNQSPSVPYYVTMWGGLVTDPDPAGVAQETTMYAWQVQLGHFHIPFQGFWRAHTGFANSEANGASCRKGNQKMTDATLATMIEELTVQNDLPHRFIVTLDSAAVTDGVGSGELSVQYDPPEGHPLYGAEVWVQVAYADNIAPEYGKPKVTKEGVDVDGGTIYRFHAGDATPGDGVGENGAVGVWWRTSGKLAKVGTGGWISCKLMDDVYVKVRPGPGLPEP